MLLKIRKVLAKICIIIARNLYKEAVSPSPYSKSPLVKFLKVLQATGFEPKVIIDVGANRGTWTRRAIRTFPSAEYHLFEPQDSLRSSLEEISKTHPNVCIHSLGVGRETGEEIFTFNSDRDDSSNFRMTASEAQARGFVQKALPLISIDDFVKKHSIACVDILKIDAEGLDLEVIKGASHTLRAVEYVFIECAILNKGLIMKLLTSLMF